MTVQVDSPEAGRIGCTIFVTAFLLTVDRCTLLKHVPTLSFKLAGIWHYSTTSAPPQQTKPMHSTGLLCHKWHSQQRLSHN